MHPSRIDFMLAMLSWGSGQCNGAGRHFHLVLAMMVRTVRIRGWIDGSPRTRAVRVKLESETTAPQGQNY
jgi:hypothetical protein